VSVAGLAGEVSLCENGFRPGAERGDLARAEIRFKVSEQAGAESEAGEQVIRNLLPAEIPKHSPQFVVLVEANPVINGEEFMSAILKKDVPAFSIRVVAEQVEEDDGFEELPVIFGEVEVVIFEIVLDELLERPRAIRTVVAEDRERDKVKAETLADEIRGDFTSRQRVFGEVP